MSTRIKAEREARGWSQQELADLVGVRHRSIVSRWEGGSRKPYPRHAIKLEALFGLPLDTLLSTKQKTPAV
jgi:transcriptional regulator with XRE-family HTH domain